MKQWRGVSCLSFVLLLFFLGFPPRSNAQTPSPSSLPPVEVHGTTPLMGIPVPREQVPANVQVATGADLTANGTFTLTDFFSRHLAGVNLTHVQNNPYQPDVSYRGFASSFLIGTPPGLSTCQEITYRFGYRVPLLACPAVQYSREVIS